MKKHLVVLLSVSILIVLSLGAYAASDSRSSNPGDQKSLELTVYNTNLGLVKDRREIKLDTGEQPLRFMGVASQVIPESVQIQSINAPDKLRVLEQNYEYDLLSPDKLLEKYVGKTIKIVDYNPYVDRQRLVEAKVLSANDGAVLQIGDEITFDYGGRMVFPEVPENLIAEPTLVWLLDNSLKGKSHTIEASYLTGGISWKADYVLTLNADDTAGDLGGWVTIDNQSGAEYRDAKLKLVAGDVARVEEPEVMYESGVMDFVSKRAAPQFQEQEFFEYHIYTLDRPSTVKQNQTKQISLLSADDIGIKKEFVFNGSSHYYRGKYGEVEQNTKIGVFVEFKNSKENKLGMPIPKGTVRMYKRDHEDSLQFIGEDTVDHTPKDEKVRLHVGDAFDIVGSRVQTDWDKKFFSTYEAAFAVTIKNHKDEDVEVRVVEPIPGDWKILNSSHKYEKTEAHTAEFLLNIPANGETKLTYRVSMEF